MVKGDSLTVCALPELFGLSKDQFRQEKLDLVYEVAGEKKTVAIDAGWKVTLPALQLAPPEPFKLIEATFRFADVTALVQKMVKGDSLTVRALPELYGLSKDKVENQSLDIEYMIGEVRKNVSVTAGWTITLPSMQLVPPQIAETPWYENHIKWIIIGVAIGLWIIWNCVRVKPAR